jgi:ankyrin repeat protein
MGASKSKLLQDKLNKVHQAISENDMDKIKKMYDKGTNKDTYKGYSCMLLSYAIENGTHDMIELLIDKGLDVSCTQRTQYHDAHPLLIHVILNARFDRRYDLKLVKLLIEKGADVNVTTQYGLTPIIVACNSENLEIAKLLIEKGANVNAANHIGKTALHTALDSCDREIVDFLIDNGADVNVTTKYGTTPLIISIKKCERETITLLIKKGADVNAAEKDGMTALLYATKDGLQSVSRDLIENGANVNAVEKDGWTALMWACEKANLELVKILIGGGADINAKNAYNFTPLIIASKEGHLEVVKELCEKGADIYHRADRGNAISYATSYNKPRVRKYLEEVIEKRKPVDTAMWKGVTKSDIQKFNHIFTDDAVNYSSCPVCLAYVRREDGCMYMYHNCSKGVYYHKYLYNMYKSHDKLIEWCTICGRITFGHRHFKLGVTGGQLPELADPVKNIREFYEGDCRGQGGGGPDEKLARFRRMREYSLELDTEIGKKPRREVMNDLVEEVWNAPLFMEKNKNVLAEIKEKKGWNDKVSNNKYRDDVSGRENNEEVNAANIPFEGERPAQRKGFNNISLEDDVDLLVFKHKQKDGSMKEHGITKEGLEDFVTRIKKDFGTDEFGYCFNNQCDAKLHPEEIKDHVTEAVYKDYKKKFNKKMAGQGGGGENVFREATDVLCSLPKRRSVTKKGGGKRKARRTRRV